ncbi:hypothetical protein [Candidatus Avelusimicrobium fimicolum]|uniref:hypothetical protein n=1 Tax=Candidatus Avelusimicrobium fimicolum TaxID=3416216 RepID=UPI003D0DBA4F
MKISSVVFQFTPYPRYPKIVLEHFAKTSLKNEKIVKSKNCKNWSFFKILKRGWGKALKMIFK